jgi:hypothetical protein
LKIAQISPIRLQVNVVQDDLAQVKVGARVMARANIDARDVVISQVTSVTPAMDAVAHTGVVEAITPNLDGAILPGQYVVMDISTGGARNALRLPAAAVRTRAVASPGVLAGVTKSYVWVADPIPGEPGEFTVQTVDVETGASGGANTEIVSGLQEGQSVVVDGADNLKNGDTVTDQNAATPAASTASGALRAADQDSGGPSTSALRAANQEIGAPGTTGTTALRAANPEIGAPGGPGNEASVDVSSRGFTPSSVKLRAGIPARLTFTRKDELNCATEVVLPDYGIKKALPLNTPVTVEFTPRKGDFEFACGMGMLTGEVVAR